MSAAPASRRLLGVAALAACLALLAAAPAAAQNTPPQQVPENLACPGRPGPQPGFHFEWQWQVFATFEKTPLEGIGRPRAVALDHACNVYVADSAGNRIVKYGPDG
ncbi:MAG TPA: hypothetical protein VFD32_10640, partial [Dehalococcoidia bacterium]|nr:hypothetical protein [Dehalococcoidia bacterium]